MSTSTFIPRRVTKIKKEQEYLEERAGKISSGISNRKSCPPVMDGVFTEVTSHGCLSVRNSVCNVNELNKIKTGDANNARADNHAFNLDSFGKGLLSFPSSAIAIAQSAKSDLESDATISRDIREKVVDKILMLVSIVQKTYESKIRAVSELEKNKEKSNRMLAERDKEHSTKIHEMTLSIMESSKSSSTNMNCCVTSNIILDVYEILQEVKEQQRITMELASKHHELLLNSMNIIPTQDLVEADHSTHAVDSELGIDMKDKKSDCSVLGKSFRVKSLYSIKNEATSSVSQLLAKLREDSINNIDYSSVFDYEEIEALSNRE